MWSEILNVIALFFCLGFILILVPLGYYYFFIIEIPKGSREGRYSESNPAKTTVKATTKKFTDEQVAHMVEVYSANPTRATVDALAQELSKSVRSIIAKLSREGVYVVQERKTRRRMRSSELIRSRHFDHEDLADDVNSLD